MTMITAILSCRPVAVRRREQVYFLQAVHLDGAEHYYYLLAQADQFQSLKQAVDRAADASGMLLSLACQHSSVPDFLEASRGSFVDIAHFGKVLASGPGTEPSPAIIRLLKEMHDLDAVSS
jgi:hypothetical protein